MDAADRQIILKESEPYRVAGACRKLAYRDHSLFFPLNQHRVFDCHFCQSYCGRGGDYSGSVSNAVWDLKQNKR